VLAPVLGDYEVGGARVGDDGIAEAFKHQRDFGAERRGRLRVGLRRG
jgi:hypothetical protein